MSKISGVPHLRAVRALERAGFRIARQGKHIVMTDGSRILTIPRHDPVDAASRRTDSASFCNNGGTHLPEPLALAHRSSTTTDHDAIASRASEKRPFLERGAFRVADVRRPH